MRGFWVVIFFLSLPLLSNEPVKISRTYTVSIEDLPSTTEALKNVASPSGKVIPFTQTGKIVVQDLSTQFSLFDEIIAAVNAPQPNVRIEVISTTFGNQKSNNINLQGRTKIGGIDVGNRDQYGWGIQGGSQSNQEDSLNSSFLVVRSGRSATLEVTQQVPQVQFFWAYAQGLGLIASGELQWEKLGTQLAIRPRVFGDQITVDVIPQIRKLNRDFFENNAVVSFESLKTSVVVADGGSIEIGGLASADENFQRYFFGYDKVSEKKDQRIRLQAQILK